MSHSGTGGKSTLFCAAIWNVFKSVSFVILKGTSQRCWVKCLFPSCFYQLSRKVGWTEVKDEKSLQLEFAIRERYDLSTVNNVRKCTLVRERIGILNEFIRRGWDTKLKRLGPFCCCSFTGMCGVSCMSKVLGISIGPGKGICRIERGLSYFCLAQNTTELIIYGMDFIFARALCVVYVHICPFSFLLLVSFLFLLLFRCLTLSRMIFSLLPMPSSLHWVSTFLSGCWNWFKAGKIRKWTRNVFKLQLKIRETP